MFNAKPFLQSLVIYHNTMCCIQFTILFKNYINKLSSKWDSILIWNFVKNRYITCANLNICFFLSIIFNVPFWKKYTRKLCQMCESQTHLKIINIMAILILYLLIFDPFSSVQICEIDYRWICMPPCSGLDSKGSFVVMSQQNVQMIDQQVENTQRLGHFIHYLPVTTGQYHLCVTIPGRPRLPSSSLDPCNNPWTHLGPLCKPVKQTAIDHESNGRLVDIWCTYCTRWQIFQALGQGMSLCTVQ